MNERHEVCVPGPLDKKSETAMGTTLTAHTIDRHQKETPALERVRVRENIREERER